MNLLNFEELKEAHEMAEFLAGRVAEAYMYYLIAVNGVNVDRYKTGDIEFSRDYLTHLLDGYIKDEKSPLQRLEFYKILLNKIDSNKPITANTIMVAGKVPPLSKLGMKFMDSFISSFGDMITEA